VNKWRTGQDSNLHILSDGDFIEILVSHGAEVVTIQFIDVLRA